MPAGRERARQPGRAVCPPQHCPWVQQCPGSTPAPDSHYSCADGGSTAAPAPRPPRAEPAGAWCSTPERCSAVRGVAAAASVLGQNSNSASIAESLRSAVLKGAVKSQRLLCQASLNAQGLTAVPGSLCARILNQQVLDITFSPTFFVQELLRTSKCKAGTTGALSLCRLAAFAMQTVKTNSSATVAKSTALCTCSLQALRCGCALRLAPESGSPAAEATGAGLTSTECCPAYRAQTVFRRES